jgi:hypothetical protein
MMNRLTATFVLCASLLCNAAAAPAGVARVRARGTGEAFTATVKKSEARFTLPAPQRPEWRWRRSETAANEREYMVSVNVVNEGRAYSFGFYLWKRAGAAQGRGNLASLVEAGQESAFARTPDGHMVIVRDAGVRVRTDGGHFVITVSGRKNVERLFSGRPAEVKIETAILGEPPASQTVPVVYEK